MDLSKGQQAIEKTPLVDDSRFQDDDDDDDDWESLEELDVSTDAGRDKFMVELAATGSKEDFHTAALMHFKKKDSNPSCSLQTNDKIANEQNRKQILKKLKLTFKEYIACTNQQTVILVTRGKPTMKCKVYGTRPLAGVIKNLQATIIEKFEDALTNHAPAPAQDDPSLFKLPVLRQPVKEMTQVELVQFIPLMLKCSIGTQKRKLRYGPKSIKPPWWPEEIPWAGLKKDCREEADKTKISWTEFLKTIVVMCYRYHGREDLLPGYTKANEDVNAPSTSQTAGQYTNTVIHSTTNPDGTANIVEDDPNNRIETVVLQEIPTTQSGKIDGPPAHTSHTTSQNDSQTEVVKLNSKIKAIVNSEGQLMLRGEYGHVTPPAFHMTESNTKRRHSDGSFYATVPKKERNDEDDMEALEVAPSGSTTL